MDQDSRALHEAARRGWPEPCRLLIEDARSIAVAQGEDSATAVAALVNNVDELGRTPLHTALANEHEHLVLLLVQAGANVNQRDNSGCTPLHIAAGRGLSAAVDLLLQTGADPNACTGDGHAPLHAAIQHGDPAIISSLLAAGADHTYVWHGLTLRAYCAHNGREDLAALLPPAEESFELASAVRSGSEALALAAAQRHAAAAARARAAPGLQPPAPVDPGLLHVAVFHNSECVVRALLQLGVTAAARDSSGAMPLTNSIFWRSDAATSLLEHGVGPFAPRFAHLFGPDGKQVLLTTLLCAQRRASEHTLPHLPNEIWLYIFSFLRPVDVQPIGAPRMRRPGTASGL